MKHLNESADMKHLNELSGRSSRKRRRAPYVDDEDIEERLESLIARVGEKSTKSLVGNLEDLADVLVMDLNKYKQKIIKILISCYLRMPEKLTIYSTLAGLLNKANYDAGGEFVEILVRNLKECIRSNEFENARKLVRLISDLVNCRVIIAGSLLSMFDNFVEVTLEDNIPQSRSDWYVYAVLSSLPWVGQELQEKKEAEFERVLSTIENYLGKRQKIHAPALRVWSTDIPHPQEEYLDCLWAQICQLKDKNNWRESAIMRPYLAFDDRLCDALSHSLPQIIPHSHHDDDSYPLPHIVFRMFDYTDVPEGPTLPGSHSIERYLIEEHLHYLIHQNCMERKDCAAALLSYHGKDQVPINYMIVEVVFSQLLQLPKAPYLELMYGVLLLELCKLQPGSMPQVLAQATEMLYERLDTMNASCIERLISWFSYHLSNFQLRWSWDDWSQVAVATDLDSPRPYFVREVFQKCMRLSYHKRLIEIVPGAFEPLLPVAPKPRYKFEGEGSEKLAGKVAAQELKQVICSKCSPEQAVDVLRDLPNPLTDDDGSDMSGIYNPLKIEVFVQTLLHLGAKSFSHSFAAIAKFHQVLRAFGETQDAQICILKSVYELWQDNQHMLVFLVDKLLKTQVVGCGAVANWIFSPEMSGDFTCSYVWEIMHSSIKKMNKHVQKLTKEVEDAKDRFEAAERRARDGLDEDNDDDVPSEEQIERMEEKLEEAQSEQKNLFLIIFQRFIIILTEHLAKCESEGRDHSTPWYKWVNERLQQVFLMHHEQVFKYIQTLESFLFTSDVDVHILSVFQQFCALRS
ncbi:hypothetical protein CAPTEDRAFT_202900 [Capitella teleta]|uniref:Nuclear cap-binding protein subunit 1 n=1 Tax=Capitella teleta TaxID=283909 RepID=R7TUE4_CAPTE|nr:hypothetical protein CAPTEDRAFT_202900 [Capitella teleta]|eukprot:ELT97533.1 hypothetical protein CAPTEDRAFT_202900 [Capitella teleta]